jgi:hypothetical protein
VLGVAGDGIAVESGDAVEASLALREVRAEVHHLEDDRVGGAADRVRCGEDGRVLARRTVRQDLRAAKRRGVGVHRDQHREDGLGGAPVSELRARCYAAGDVTGGVGD